MDAIRAPGLIVVLTFRPALAAKESGFLFRPEEKKH